jgi:glycosyltransferase involved in cell wall biosynthesis
MSLLRFLKWFKTNTDIPFQVLLQSGGELLPEFEALAPVSVLYRESFPQLMIGRNVLGAFGVKKIANMVYLKALKETLIRRNIGLIYSNTAANGEVLEFLSKLACPVISHIRELEYYIRYHIGKEDFERVKKYTHRYIAISKAVKRNLIENHNIAENVIDIVYNFLSGPSYPVQHAQQVYAEIRKRLQLPEKAFIVCASGTTDWRKGPDIFLQLAYFVRTHHPRLPVYFLWVGGENHGRNFGRLWYDVKRLGLEDAIRFLGVQSNPLEYFAACDVFAMVSREEPFGLVCIEAASVGKPVVCFDGAGGAQEFVEDDCGYVVPYLDVEAMATKIVAMLTLPERRARLGQRAQQKVAERHAVEIVAPKIFHIIQQFW